MGEREKLWYFPALGSSNSNDSTICGQQVPPWFLLGSQILAVAVNMSLGTQFPLSSLQVFVVTLNIFAFWVPQSLYHLCNQLPVTKCPLKYLEYFP